MTENFNSLSRKSKIFFAKITLIQREIHDAFNKEDSIKTNISNLLGHRGPSFTPQDKNIMERFEIREPLYIKRARK